MLKKTCFVLLVLLLGLGILPANSTYDCDFLGKTLRLSFLFKMEYGEEGVSINDSDKGMDIRVMEFTGEGKGMLNGERSFTWYYEDGPEFESEQIYTGGQEELTIQAPYYSASGNRFSMIFRVKDDLLYAWIPVSRDLRYVAVFRYEAD